VLTRFDLSNKATANLAGPGAIQASGQSLLA